MSSKFEVRGGSEVFPLSLPSKKKGPRENIEQSQTRNEKSPIGESAIVVDGEDVPIFRRSVTGRDMNIADIFAPPPCS